MDRIHMLTDVFEGAADILKKQKHAGLEPSSLTAENQMVDAAIERAVKRQVQYYEKHIREEVSGQKKALRGMLMEMMTNGGPVAQRFR